jgi:hypothetical protein
LTLSGTRWSELSVSAATAPDVEGATAALLAAAEDEVGEDEVTVAVAELEFI